MQNKNPLLVQKKWFVVLSLIAFCLILTIWFRGSLPIKGSDAPHYFQMFVSYSKFSLSFVDYFKSLLWTGSFGFILWNTFIGIFTDNGHVYLFLTSFTTIGLLFFSFSKFFELRKEKKLYFLAILLLVSSSSFYFYSLNILRQAFMAPFLLLSIHALIHSQTRKSLFFLFIGTLFHYSLILFIPSMIAYKYFKRFTPPHALFYICFVGSFALKASIVVGFLQATQLHFLAFKANKYLTPVYFELNVLVKAVILFIILHGFYFIYRYSKDTLFNELYYISCLLFSTALLTFQMSGIMNRFIMFISILLPILFTRSIYSFRRKRDYFLAILLASLFYFGVIMNHPSIQSQFQ